MLYWYLKGSAKDSRWEWSSENETGGVATHHIHQIWGTGDVATEIAKRFSCLEILKRIMKDK